MTSELRIDRHRRLLELHNGLESFAAIARDYNAPLLAYLIGMAQIQAKADAMAEGRRRRKLRISTGNEGPAQK